MSSLFVKKYAQNAYFLFLFLKSFFFFQKIKMC
nr:MAG TPA: hypothetical protein [Caudoviricetes sp.]